MASKRVGENCPNRDKHTNDPTEPTGYIAWHEWAAWMVLGWLASQGLLRRTVCESAVCRDWEFLASLAFAYVDAPEGTDDVSAAWAELAGSIKHWRAVGGPEPRDPDAIRPGWAWVAP